MAVLLSALAEDTDAELRLLLVEEPEAHLHPQLQDLLMRFLEEESGTRDLVSVLALLDRGQDHVAADRRRG